ncbi:hypothetical protein GCK32_022729, partial [Trichostrongylus colubriformis]
MDSSLKHRNKGPSAPLPSVTRLMSSSILDNDGLGLLKKIHDVLVVKAPEAIELLDQFL